MTINQKIKMLEALKALMDDLDEREKNLREDIEYYEKQFEEGEDRTNEYDYRVKNIKDDKDAIEATKILRKELEKLA